MMTIGFQTPEVDETQIRRTRLELQKSPTCGSKSPMGLEPVQKTIMRGLHLAESPP